MTMRNLNYIFAPSSVALIGGDQSSKTLEGVLATNLFAAGFKGEIYTVNPKHQTITGVTAYPDIASLPHAPELAVIAAPTEGVPKLITELGNLGTMAAVVINGGFTNSITPHEPDRQTLTSAMLAAAKPYLFRIIGPNSLGIMVPGIGLNASFGHLQPLPGNLAFVAQSGAVLTTVLDWATSKKIGFSHCVCLGDMADVDFGDMLDYLANDYNTRAILLYIESITHARKFMSAARAAARIKPVIVVKAGRYAERPGTLTGSDAVYEAAFRRAGILRVNDMQALFDAVQTLAMARQIAGERLAILTNSSGMGTMAADALVDRGGSLAELHPETIDILNRTLPPTWSHTNPVDITGEAHENRYALYSDALDPLIQDKGVDAVLVLNCPTAITSSTEAARAVINVLHNAPSQYRPTVVLTCWMGETSAAKARRIFIENQVPTYTTPIEAVRGFMQLVRYRKSQDMLLETPPNIPEEFTPNTTRAQQLIDGALAENRACLTEAETEAVLAAYAIPSMETDTLATHRLNSQLVIGMEVDTLFGPVILVGPGGESMETNRDYALTLPPLNMHLAREMIRRRRIYRLFQGETKSKEVILDSIALTLVKLSQLVCDVGDIAELVINTLLDGQRGVMVKDARIKLDKATRPGVDRLAILPYPKELEETLDLPDGQSLLIRPIRPEDEPAFQKIFQSLSPEEIRLRFLHPMKIMPHSLAARLTQIDYDREMALVVEGTDKTGEMELYGVVQISADPDNERAEYAILLRGDMTGLGLGPMLLRRIIDYATCRGIGEIYGEVLSENRSMLKLCRVFGFQVKSDREDPGVMQVCLKL